MLRDDAYLLDILESARAALAYMDGRTRDEFSNNTLLQDAVVRRLEIIGEASGRISEDTQKKHAHLPWQAMKGTRNKIIHEYDSVELEIIWKIVREDLPSLVGKLEKIVPSM